MLVPSGILLDREGCGGKLSSLLVPQRGTKHSVPLVFFPQHFPSNIN